MKTVFEQPSSVQKSRWLHNTRLGGVFAILVTAPFESQTLDNVPKNFPTIYPTVIVGKLDVHDFHFFI